MHTSISKWQKSQDEQSIVNAYVDIKAFYGTLKYTVRYLKQQQQKRAQTVDTENYTNKTKNYPNVCDLPRILIWEIQWRHSGPAGIKPALTKRL